jgi:hypothetical protein
MRSLVVGVAAIGTAGSLLGCSCKALAVLYLFKKLYQKGVYYLGVKVFNKLPTYIKEEFDNTKKFKKNITEIFE